MTQNPRVVRGYAAALSSALNQCKDGAYLQIDYGTGQGAREILLDHARCLEVAAIQNLQASKVRVIYWNFGHPWLVELFKSQDPVLAVDAQDALEQVVKVLEKVTSPGHRFTIAEEPVSAGVSKILLKGQIVAWTVQVPKYGEQA